MPLNGIRRGCGAIAIAIACGPTTSAPGEPQADSSGPTGGDDGSSTDALGSTGASGADTGSSGADTDGKGEVLAAAPMLTPRFGHTATRLSDGRIFVVGGRDCGVEALSETELYDPDQDLWSAAAASQPHVGHTTTLLGDGRVIAFDGSAPETYDPRTDSWANLQPFPRPVEARSTRVFAVAALGEQSAIGLMSTEGENWISRLDGDAWLDADQFMSARSTLFSAGGDAIALFGDPEDGIVRGRRYSPNATGYEAFEIGDMAPFFEGPGLAVNDGGVVFVALLGDFENVAAIHFDASGWETNVVSSFPGLDHVMAADGLGRIGIFEFGGYASSVLEPAYQTRHTLERITGVWGQAAVAGLAGDGGFVVTGGQEVVDWGEPGLGGGPCGVDLTHRWDP